MTFDPSQHLIQLKGKDYLEVKWRLAWLRDSEPDARIETECLESSADYASFKATITLPTGAVATGHGSEEKKDFGDFYEKAETKAIGRALGALGFGTQFTDDFEFGAEQGRVVDSPVERTPSRASRQSAPRGQGQPLADQVKKRSQPAESDSALITDKQIGFAKSLIEDKGYDGQARDTLLITLVRGVTNQDDIAAMTRPAASKMIDYIKSDVFNKWADEKLAEIDNEEAPF
jgi:hypothetical protein